MKRRMIVLGGAALIGAGGAGFLPFGRHASGEPVSTRSFDWTAADFRAGGTAGLPAELPPPIFRASPQCVATLAKTAGPCHTNDVAVRKDVTEGVAGLPVRPALARSTRASIQPSRCSCRSCWRTASPVSCRIDASCAIVAEPCCFSAVRIARRLSGN